MDDTSSNDEVRARTPVEPVHLEEVGRDLLREATEGGSGTAAATLTPSQAPEVTQTVVALTAGASLAPDRWNGPASVQVLTGRSHLATSDVDLTPGTWARLTDVEELTAVEDTVALLTVHVGTHS